MTEGAAAPVSQGGDSSPGIQDTRVQDSTQPPAPPIPDFKGTKHKLKIDDMEEEVEYEELVARAQRAKGSEKRFDEARKALDEAGLTKKQVEAIKKRIAEGDVDALIEFVGYDTALKISETLTWNKIQWDELSPDERERIVLKHENDQLKSERQREKEAIEAQKKAENDAKAQAVLQREIDGLTEALKTEGLSDEDVSRITEQSIDDMISYLDYLDSLKEAGQPLPSSLLSLQDVAKKLQSRMVERTNASIGKLSVETLRSVLTKEQLAGLRQLELDDLAPIHDRTESRKSKSESLFEEAKKPSRAARRMSTDEAFDRLDSLYD